MGDVSFLVAEENFVEIGRAVSDCWGDYCKMLWRKGKRELYRERFWWTLLVLARLTHADLSLLTCVLVFL